MSLITRLHRLEARRRPRLCDLFPPSLSLAEVAEAWEYSEDEARAELMKIQGKRTSLTHEKRGVGTDRPCRHDDLHDDVAMQTIGRLSRGVALGSYNRGMRSEAP